jgi:hypothetical protein
MGKDKAKYEKKLTKIRKIKQMVKMDQSEKLGRNLVYL